MKQRTNKRGRTRRAGGRLDESPRSVSASGLNPAIVFEVSWEVCRQAGGIYTVLRSKAPAAVSAWGDNYWLIGPFNEAAAKIEFEPQPAEGVFADTSSDLAQRGIRVHTGRWLITGRPRVMLIDTDPIAGRLDEMKYFLWKDLNIGTPPHEADTNACVLFGYALADLLATLHRRIAGFPMLVQFHEWQAALALLLLRHRDVRFPTVFTTHATLVGRSLCAANYDLYSHIENVNAEAVANEHGILHRFQIERAAAQHADVFTTVSEITGLEAEHFFDRKPEVVLPNGLNVERSAAPHEFQNMHRECKEKIHNFVRGHFFSSYTFDLQRTLYVFTAGRYEYRNKGIDVFIDALAELNRRLKAHSEGVTVVAFIITRAAYHRLNNEALNRQAMFNELRNTCHNISEDAGRRLFDCVTAGRMPTLDDLFDEYARVRLKRMMHAWLQGPPPTIVTHDLVDDLHDPVLAHLRRAGLLNAADDPVKVLFHPEFITSTSPILGLEYDEFVRGCNLGVFPSYYEPWGYTPMECVIRGVPAVTSDLSGFGVYIMDRFPDHDVEGMAVARRRNVSYDTTVYQVAGWMHSLARMSLRERIALRNRTEQHAEAFDWKQMSSYYRAARRRAFEVHYPNLNIIPAVTE